MNSLDDVFQSALSLSLDERARLAERLLRSLDEVSEEEAQSLWLDEADRRIRDFRAGKVEAIPGEQILEEARELIR